MDVRKELEAKDCIFWAHFVGASGKHLAGYCNNDRAMPYAAFIDELTKLMVEPFKDEQIDTIVVPATGAIPLAHLGALQMQKLTGKEVLGVWADKIKVNGEKDFTFERDGYEAAVKGKKVLILEDFINQMFTIKKVIELVRRVGGDVRGVASMERNKGVTAEALDVPMYHALCDVEYDAWTPEECARVGLCAKKAPMVTDIGHGDDFQTANPDYPGGFVRLLKDS